MFKNLSITIKFFIIGAIIFIIMAVLLAVSVNKLIHELLINRSKLFISDFIQLQAKNNLTQEDFYSQNIYYENNIFKEFVEKIKTKEILRVKIWNKNKTVIFSDDKSIIGKSFQDNAELEEALNGETAAEISHPQKSENADEKKYNELLEIYIPVNFNEKKQPDGVIEVYFGMDSLNKLQMETKVKIFYIIIINIIILYLFLLIFFRIFIKNPIINLKETAEEIMKGNLNKKAAVKTKDEIGMLAETLNKIITDLKNHKENNSDKSG